MIDELIQAAEHIDKHGWTQGMAVNDAGQVCMMGAIDAVCSENVSIGDIIGIENHLENFLIAKYDKSYYEHDHVKGVVATINDDVLNSGEEASKLLREAAEWEPNGR